MLRAGNPIPEISPAFVLHGKGPLGNVPDGESNFRTLADHAPVVVWMTDSQGGFTYISRFWRKLTGRSPKKDLGQRWVNALHPKDRSRAAKDLLECVRTERVCEGEYRVRHADGQYAWVFSHGAPYFHVDGSYAGHIGTCVDITVRKSREVERIRIHDSLLLGQEAERKRIARELHDDIGQKLALLGVALSEIEQLSKTGPTVVKQKLRGLRKAIDRLASDTHLMSHNLHPAVLTHLGLVPALRRLCNDFSARTQMNVEFSGDNVLNELPQEVSIALFRIAQECLSNAAKHSGVKRIEVQLHEESGEIHLTIRDLGKGFDVGAAQKGRGLGLTSMQERVRAVNGKIAIESKPMGGTTIEVRVPLESHYSAQRAS
jgi:PAS domain S-box-containing protein